MNESTSELLLDGNRGVYVPQAFAEGFDLNDWGITDEEDIAILLAGPEEEFYWDVWERVLSDASYTDTDGHTWSLYQEGDLWSVRDDHEWEEGTY